MHYADKPRLGLAVDTTRLRAAWRLLDICSIAFSTEWRAMGEPPQIRLADRRAAAIRGPTHRVRSLTVTCESTCDRHGKGGVYMPMRLMGYSGAALAQAPD